MAIETSVGATVWLKDPLTAPIFCCDGAGAACSGYKHAANGNSRDVSVGRAPVCGTGSVRQSGLRSDRTVGSIAIPALSRHFEIQRHSPAGRPRNRAHFRIKLSAPSASSRKIMSHPAKRQSRGQRASCKSISLKDYPVKNSRRECGEENVFSVQ